MASHNFRKSDRFGPEIQKYAQERAVRPANLGHDPRQRSIGRPQRRPVPSRHARSAEHAGADNAVLADRPPRDRKRSDSPNSSGGEAVLDAAFVYQPVRMRVAPATADDTRELLAAVRFRRDEMLDQRRGRCRVVFENAPREFGAVGLSESSDGTDRRGDVALFRVDQRHGEDLQSNVVPYRPGARHAPCPSTGVARPESVEAVTDVTQTCGTRDTTP